MGVKILRVAIIAQAAEYADEFEQRRLELTPTDRVLRLARLRLQDDRPLSYEEIALPLALFPGLTEQEIVSDILEIAERYGVALGNATEQVRFINASKAIAGHLRVAIGTQLLKLDRVVQSSDGQPVEWRRAFAIVAPLFRSTVLRQPIALMQPTPLA